MRETGKCQQHEGERPPHLSNDLRARVWIAASCFFSRSSAQDRCWLWLHTGDGQVHALWLPAMYFGRDEVIATLLPRLRIDSDMPVVLESGPWHAQPLPRAPVVPLPRWSVSWGHPVQCAIRAFASELDIEVLHVLGRLEVPGPYFGSVRNYNRIAAFPQPIPRHRVQALFRFPPLVASFLLDRCERPDMFGDDEDSSSAALLGTTATCSVLDAIDRGRDVIGALAEHHRIDRALVRSPLCRTPWTTGHAPREALRLLRAIPAHARPRTSEELEAHLPNLHALPIRPRSEHDVRRLAAAFAQGWAPTWHRLEQRFRPLAPALRDTRDFLAAAIDQQALPVNLAHIDVNTLGLAWLTRLGLISLLDASRRWHAQPVDTEASRLANGLRTEVAALIGEASLSEGRLRELVTHKALIAEGDGMRHCVGDYWARCVFTGARIVHLQTPGGETATAEYALDCNSAAQTTAFHLTQLLGPHNAQCSTDMQAFAAHVETLLNAPHLHEKRLEIAHKASDDRLAHRQARGTHTLRPLDMRSRRELARVLAYCAGQDDWRAPIGEVLRASVAGFQYAEGRHHSNRFDLGDALDLVREPGNAFDALAVRIDWHSCKLGYVPRPDNAQITRLLDAGRVLNARIVGLAENPEWPQVEFAITQVSAAG